MSDPKPNTNEASDELLQEVHAELMNNKEAPKTGFSMLPIAILFIAIVLSFAGGIYLIEHSGGFDPLVYDAHTKYEPGSGGVVEFDPIAHGQKVYNRNCVACHQANGAGIAGVFPTLHGTKWVNGDARRFAAIVLNGLVGEIEVKGEVYNSNMTAHNFLSDKDIAAVMSFVRTNAEWGNSTEIVAEELVAGVRGAEGSRSSQWTAAELVEIWPHQ